MTAATDTDDRRWPPPTATSSTVAGANPTSPRSSPRSRPPAWSRPCRVTGPFTVFAPTNDAFAALPDGLVDELLLPENKDALTQILTYHVVAGQVMAADVAAGDVPTVEGTDIAITVDGGVMVFDANVVADRRGGLQRCHPRHRPGAPAARPRRRGTAR